MEYQRGVEEIQSLLRKMDAAEVEVQHEIAKIPPQWKEEAKAARVAELKQAHLERLADWRERGLELMAKASDAVELESAKGKIELAPKGAAWQEAEARRVFVQEEVQSLPVADLPAQYALLKDAGDAVGSWLLGRYAMKRCAELLASNTPEGKEALPVGEQLEDLMYGKVTSKRKAQQRTLNELRAELRTAHGQVEERAELDQYATRYGARLPPDQG